MEDDVRWNALKIGLVASLALELLSKFGFGEATGKAWHDAARNVDPASGAESQCEVSGNGTQQGAEQIECGATDVATIVERSSSDLRGISAGHGHTIDGRQRYRGLQGRIRTELALPIHAQSAGAVGR